MDQKIDSESFKRFFFHGIENKREVKEGILYFSSNKVYNKHSKENWHEIPNEQFETEIIQEAVKKYRQFYQFVILNDENNSDTQDISLEELEKDLEEELQLLKKEGKVIDTQAGVFFLREREEYLKGGKRYIYGEGLQGEDGWTKQVYDILEKLEYLEKENNEKYHDYLLLTKYARAINRFDEKEALKIKQAYEKRKEQSEKEQENESLL